MSTTIDERVVGMRFDNQHFERNVQTSLGTIEKLKNSLNLTGASKGLENIDTAAKNVNMSGLSSAVETVGLKFNALYTIADQALRNITNSAYYAGKQIVSALTIDPVKAGFNEYELKMGSIQTIMASTGEELETVNKYLNELNEYSDKTIYSFSDMTQNIGKFTNAGVKLEDAVAAIQGISNEAAVSGANAGEASRAMYNFAQALSSGYVKLIDWKSIENANMATLEFKNQLIDTAVELGTVTKGADGMYTTLSGKTFNATKNFNDVLQEQWMTSDVLITTLKKYSDETTEIGKKAFSAAQDVKTLSQLYDTLKESAQSGWAQTWEYIVGDLNEAKTELRKINEIIGGVLDASADARNAVLEGWKQQGGRITLFESLYNVLDAIGKLVAPIKQAFSDIFPPFTADTLVAITNALKEFTEKIKIGDKTSENLRRTFRGLFAVLDIVVEAFKAVYNFLKPIVGLAGKLAGGILGVTGSFGDWLVKVRDAIKQSNIFNNVLQGVYSILEAVGKVLKKVYDYLKEKIFIPGWELFHSFLKRIQDRMSDVHDAASSMADGFNNAMDEIASSVSSNPILRILGALWKAIQIIFTGIGKAVGFLTEGLAEKISNADFQGIFDFINTLSLSGIAAFFGKFVKGFSDAVESVTDIKDSIVGILDSVKDVFKAYQEQLKAQTLLTIAKAIGILAVSLLLIALIDSDKLSAALGGLTVLLVDLMGALAIFGRISGDTKNVFKSAGFLLALATAVLILAGALKIVGSLNFGEMMTGLVGIAGVTAILIGVVKVLTHKSSDEKEVIKGAGKLIIISTAMVIAASALKIIASLNWSELAVGLIGFTVMLGSMIGAIKLLTTIDNKTAVKGAGSMFVMATSMVILASALKIISTLSWEKLAISLLGLVTTLGVMVGAIKILTTTDSKTVVKGAGSMFVMATSLVILASALKIIATLDWEQLAISLIGLTVALGAIVGAFVILNTLEKSIGKGAGAILVVSASLVILAAALKIIGSLNWNELAVGLVGIGVVLGLMVAAFAIMGTLSGSILAGAGAILMMSTALLILAPALSILGAMSWGAIAKGLIAIAGAFVILGVAGYVLAPVAGVILALAAAFALLGVGVIAIGVGLLAVGVGITAVVTAVAGGVTVIVSAIVAVVTGILAAIPTIVKIIGDLIVGVCNVIVESAPALARAIKAIVLSVCEVLVECVPVIVDSVFTLLINILDALVEYTPQVVDAIFEFLIGVLDGIARNLPALIQSAVDILVAFFKGIFDALSGIDSSTLVEVVLGVGMLAALMIALSAVASLVPAAMLGVLGIGLVVAELALVLAAIGAIAQIPGLSWLINEGGELLEDIGVAIGKFVGGLVGGFASGVSSQFPQIASDLSAFMTNLQPFIEGAKMIDPETMVGMQALAAAILALTAANVIEGITSFFTGESSLAAFGKELADFGPHFAKYHNAVKGVDGTVVQASANAALSLAEMAAKLPNQGGMVSWFTGDNTLAMFAEELATFGPKMKQYADSVAGIDVSVVTASANAAMSLAEMANNLPNQGGIVSWFTGDNTLSMFAEELNKFGPKIKEYADIVKDIDGRAVTGSANAAKTLAELANSLPNQGGIVSWFTGDKDLGKFGENLVKLAQGLKEYADELSGTDVTRMRESAASFASIVSLFNGIDDINFANLDTFTSSLKKIGTGGVDGFIKAFSDAKEKIANTGKQMIDTFLTGVNTTMIKLTVAFTAVLDTSITAIHGKYSAFYDAGAYLVKGFANGINEFTYQAEAKARAMAAAAASAAKDELDEHSPSRVGYGIGKFFGMGFVNAIDDYSSKSYDAGSTIAKSARNGLNDSISKISDFIDSGMDTQPTIRPVLDLSDVRSGADTISNLLGMDSMSILSSVGSVSAMMNRRNQNGDTEEIVSEIKKLNKNLENAGGTQYNINGITYDDGSNIAEAVKSIARAAVVGRRV